MEYLIVFLFIYAMYLIQKGINKQRVQYEEKIEELNHKLDDIRQELNELRHEVEYQNLTDIEKEEVAFENARVSLCPKSLRK